MKTLFLLYVIIGGLGECVLQRGIFEVFHSATNLHSTRLMPKGTVLLSLFSPGMYCCLLPRDRPGDPVVGG